MNTYEKRLEPRVTLKETAGYRVINSDEKGGLLDFSGMNVQNVSRSGLCADFGTNLEKGSILKLKFFNKCGENKNSGCIRAFGEVVWARESVGGRYEAGINFITMKDEDAKILGEYVDEWKKLEKAV